MIKQNNMQRHEFQNIGLYKAGKVVVSEGNIFLDVWWRQIPHEQFHVLRELWDM